ncbi:arginine--tRNA ligase [Candidatus Uhrbacteria bacterium]|nr:arginine--tRNA ligase [Candidatus Uhrbacteria bacterium]
MYVIQEAKQQILTELKKAVGKGYVPSLNDLDTPPDTSMGDVAFPCFELAKKLKKSPKDIAVEIAAKIAPKDYVGHVKAVGPYVNFTYSHEGFGAGVMGQVKDMKEKYGTSNVGEDKRLMVEFANLNSHKDVHVGHLRNLFVGQMTTEIFKANGYDVIPVAYINDLGLHVAKSIWATKTFHDIEDVPEDQQMEFLRNVYVEANKKLEEKPELKSEVTEVFQALENQRGDDVALWKKTRTWSLDYLKEVYDELNLTIDHWYFESELIKKTRKILDELIKEGLVVQSEGAWIVDLRDEDLGVNLLIKSDGTLLYNSKDLGLALKKEEDFHPVRSIYVVDARQSHALRQLFATLKHMQFDRELTHLSYEFVTLQDGAMAARKGNVIRYALFRDKMISRAKRETKERHPDWSDEQVLKVARALTFAAMRFGMLKQDVEKKIVFDLDEAMSFEGFTGPYVLYMNARIQSVLTKANKKDFDWNADQLTEVSAHKLLALLGQYPEIVFGTSQNLQLSKIPQYLFELAKTFSDFYASAPILKSEPKVMAQRLALVASVQIVLKSGLQLIGIETVDEM